MKYNDMIFVFGSNLAGRHGKGAALHAKEVLFSPEWFEHDTNN